tara:strand:- start:27035 stop:28147 length:1113 start_codon:yes stop_codon:yes gene_type:complete
MYKIRKIITISLLLSLATPVHAGITWSKENGWNFEGGLMERYFGSSEKARNAIEMMNQAREYQEEEQYRKALGLYKKVYKRYRSSELAPEAYFQTAQIRKTRKQYRDAFEALNTIVSNYPDYDKFNEVINEQIEIASALMAGNRPYYFGLIPGLRDYHSSIKFFERIVDNAPNSSFAPQALMNIAMLNKKHGSTEETVDALDRMINNYPNSDLTPDAYLLLAKTYRSQVKGPEYDQGSTREAMSYYEDFTILFPDHPNLAVAEEGLQAMKDTYARSSLIMGDFYRNYRNNNRAALVFYNNTITSAPVSEAATQAKEQIQLIKKGVPPPRTPVDFLFGRYDEDLANAGLNDVYLEEDFEGNEDLVAPGQET